jgi:hypothetical protein
MCFYKKARNYGKSTVGFYFGLRASQFKAKGRDNKTNIIQNCSFFSYYFIALKFIDDR